MSAAAEVCEVRDVDVLAEILEVASGCEYSVALSFIAFRWRVCRSIS